MSGDLDQVFADLHGQQILRSQRFHDQDFHLQGIRGGFVERLHVFGPDPHQDRLPIVGSEKGLHGICGTDIEIAYPHTHMAVLALDLALHEIHGRCANKAAHKAVGWEVVYRFRFVTLQDLPLFHDGDPISHAQGFDLIVGYVDRCRFDLLQQAFELGTHFQPQQGIQVAERLVHQQHLGPHRNGPRHGDALPLSTAHFAGETVQHVFDMQQGGGIPDPFVDLVLVELVHLQSKGDVVIHGHMWEDGITLEDHGDLALARRQVSDIPPSDADAPLIRHSQTGNGTQQSRLAAAAWTQQDDKFLVFDGEAYIIHCHKIVKALGYVFDSNICHVDLLLGNLAPHIEQVAPDVEDKDQGREHHKEAAGKLVRFG